MKRSRTPATLAAVAFVVALILLSVGLSVVAVRMLGLVSNTNSNEGLPRSSQPCDTRPATTRFGLGQGRINYDWSDLHYGVVMGSPMKGTQAQTDFNRRVITVFVRDCWTPDAIAQILAHEIGHAVDRSYNSSGRRYDWSVLRGYGAKPWFPSCNCTDFAYGAGDFAETFAWLKAPHALPFASRLAGPPDLTRPDAYEWFFHPTAPPVTTTTTTTTTVPITTTTEYPSITLMIPSTSEG